jgi:cytochrome P450
LPLGSGILVLNKHRTPANPATQQLIQQAGTHNVSYTISAIITHLLLNPTKLQIMRAELGPVFANTDFPTWCTLEKLPYLTAVIKEGLRSAFLFSCIGRQLTLHFRMAMGAMNRSARVSPYEDLQYGKWILPKGFPVSMSSYWMHNDPNVFHNPEIFMPERWLCGPDELKMMNGSFVPFSRGSRGCLARKYVNVINLFASSPPSAFGQRLTT